MPATKKRLLTSNTHWKPLKTMHLKNNLDEKVCEGEEWFDAMYYATGERGDSILATWEEYLLERLMTDEKFYFAADIGDYDF